MRLVIVIAFLFLLVFSKAGFARKHPLEFKLYYAGYAVSLPSWVGTKPDTFHCFAMVLTNTSNKDVKFGHFTCGWPGIFEAVNNEVEYIGYRCTANYPTTSTLKPGKSCTNYGFYTKLLPNTNSIQMKFWYVEGESFLKHVNQNSWGLQKGERRIDIYPVYIRSNICKIDSKVKIDYFHHLSFMGQEKIPYIWIYYCVKQDPSSNRFFRNYNRLFMN